MSNPIDHDLWLSEDEVKSLTGKSQVPKQEEVLKKMNIPHKFNGERIIVVRHWLERAPFEQSQNQTSVVPQGGKVSIGAFGGKA